MGCERETYITECDTREEAAQIAREEYEGAYIVEARKCANLQLSEHFDAEYFLERTNDCNKDLWDEYGEWMPFATTPEQTASLQCAVRAAIAKWQEENEIKFVPFVFAETRNEEWIPGPDDNE